VGRVGRLTGRMPAWKEHAGSRSPGGGPGARPGIRQIHALRPTTRGAPAPRASRARGDCRDRIMEDSDGSAPVEHRTHGSSARASKRSRLTSVPVSVTTSGQPIRRAIVKPSAARPVGRGTRDQRQDDISEARRSSDDGVMPRKGPRSRGRRRRARRRARCAQTVTAVCLEWTGKGERRQEGEDDGTMGEARVHAGPRLRATELRATRGAPAEAVCGIVSS